MPKVFGSSELCNFLKRRNFIPRRRKATSHLVYLPPKTFKVSHGIKYPFVTVVMGRKNYDPVTCNSIRRQLIRLGFTLKEIEEALG